MLGFSTIIFLIGSIGFLISLILLIVHAIKKKNTKKAAKMVAGFFALAMLGIIISMRAFDTYKKTATTKTTAKKTEQKKEKTPEELAAEKKAKEDAAKKIAAEKKAKEEKEKAKKAEENRAILITTAKGVVKKNLKAPSTAKFPWSFNEYGIKETNSENKDMVIYYVSGYVDAENSFGAKLRNNFIVKMECTKDMSKYRVLDVSIR